MITLSTLVPACADCTGAPGSTGVCILVTGHSVPRIADVAGPNRPNPLARGRGGTIRTPRLQLHADCIQLRRGRRAHTRTPKLSSGARGSDCYGNPSSASERAGPCMGDHREGKDRNRPHAGPQPSQCATHASGFAMTRPTRHVHCSPLSSVGVPQPCRDATDTIGRAPIHRRWGRAFVCGGGGGGGGINGRFRSTTAFVWGGGGGVGQSHGSSQGSGG